MSFVNLLETGKGSDCTVRCGDQEWKTHKLILGCMSAYFETAFNSGFQEGTTGVIELEEDPKHVKIMLEYIYGNKTSDAFCSLSAIEICDLHAAMDKYLVRGFADFAAISFRYLARGLLVTKKDVTGFIKLFSHALSYPQQQVQLIIDNLKKIAVKEAELLLKESSFKPIVDGCEGLAPDLLAAISKRALDLRDTDGVPMTVVCPTMNCRSGGMEWTFRNGPDFLNGTCCRYCGYRALEFRSHTDNCCKRPMRLVCTAVHCKSAGKVWTTCGGSFQNHASQPRCIWCGNSDRVQLAPRSDEQRDGCGVCGFTTAADVAK